jgi:hypothetical protein
VGAKFTLRNHIVVKTYDLTQENLNAAIESAVSWQKEAHRVSGEKKELALRGDEISDEALRLANENVRLRSVLKTLMDAHRAVFQHSLFTAFRAGESNFQHAWLDAEKALGEEIRAESDK